VDALCNVQALLTNGLLYVGELSEDSIFNVLLQMIPGLENSLMEGSEDEVLSIAAMVILCNFLVLFTHLCLHRSRKVYPAPDLMTQKA
jgi:hypothetical protein